MTSLQGSPRPQDPTRAIATPAPEFVSDDIEQLLKNEYRLAGELRPLISERDQNFQLTAADQRCYVVKIANSAEDEVIVDFQIQALRHLETEKCRVPVPRIVSTNEGSALTSISRGGARHLVRVVTYLPGVPLEGTSPDVHLGYELGAALATIDQVLCDFEHPGDHQDLLWDMQRATELRNLVQHVAEPGLRSVVHECLDDFENHAAPAFASLRRQVIHNDLNPGNVLVTDDGAIAVAGVIDFGDMLRAPLVVDVAIAASYLRAEGKNALDPAISLAAGFNSVTALDDHEVALLYDLVRTRLATTITIMHWRKSLRSDDDAYLQKAFSTEHGSERFLEQLNGVSREYFVDRIRGACVSNQV